MNSLGAAGMGKSEASQVERRNVSAIAGVLIYTRCWWLSSNTCMTLVGYSGWWSLSGGDVAAHDADEVELV